MARSRTPSDRFPVGKASRQGLVEGRRLTRTTRRIQRLPGLVKPAPWAVRRAQVAPEWDWFYDNLVEAWLWGSPVRGILKGYEGVLTNGASYVPSDIGRVLDFDGDNDLVEFGTIPTGHPLQLDYLHTIMAVVRRNTLASGDGWQRIVDKSDGGSAANGYSLWFDDASDGHVRYQVNGSSGILGVTGVPAGAWWTVFGRYDGTDALISVPGFSDGVPHSATAVDAATNLRFGSWNHDVGRELAGQIALVAMFRGLLTTQQMNCLANQIGGDPFGPFRFARSLPMPLQFRQPVRR